MDIIANYHFTIDTNHDYIEGAQPQKVHFLRKLLRRYPVCITYYWF